MQEADEEGGLSRSYFQLIKVILPYTTEEADLTGLETQAGKQAALRSDVWKHR